MSVRENIIKDSRYISEMADDPFEPLPYKPISADSHVTEPPNCYIDHIEPKFRDRAPRVETGPDGGALYVIEGFNEGKTYTKEIGGMAAAGCDPREMRLENRKFEELHRGGYDGKARIADQDRDGIGGEVIYPSVGMLLCNHPDVEFKQACMWAYNRWLQEFQSAAPDRIFGLGQTAVVTPEQAVKDLIAIKEMGFVGAMLPCDPAQDLEYDDPQFDQVWEASVGLQLPITFHILTSKREVKTLASVRAKTAANRNMAHFHHTLIRANQDVIGTFVWGRIFERFPALKLVCAEADAGWVPHFMYRLDHFYRRHRFHSKTQEMSKLPSERISENVYFTFQDDLIALNSIDMMNPRHLLWANDFPHSDSTWPWSQQLIAEQMRDLSDEERRLILRDNVIELFSLQQKIGCDRSSV